MDEAESWIEILNPNELQPLSRQVLCHKNMNCALYKRHICLFLQRLEKKMPDNRRQIADFRCQIIDFRQGQRGFHSSTDRIAVS